MAGSWTVWLTALGLLFLFAPAVHPAVPLTSPVVVQGAQWALYDVSSIKGAPYCLPYENSGYSLEIKDVDPVSRRVLVHSRPDDLECRAVFPPPAGSMPLESAAFARSHGDWPELTRLSRSLTSSCRTQYQAVNQVLCWVSGAIDYSSEPDVAMHPLEVYRQRKANCVGTSELAVALLREAGIPARGVRGYLASGSAADFPSTGRQDRESSLGEEGLHRWIEVYYPGVGWIFSDPFRSVNFVSKRYLVFDLEATPGSRPYPARFERVRLELDNPESTFIRLLDHGGQIVQTDVLPGLEARHGMAVRRNEPVQYKPCCIGQVSVRPDSGVPAPDEVRLLPADPTWVCPARVAAVRRGVFSFTDLEEGEYRLCFYYAGFFMGERRTRVQSPTRGAATVRFELGDEVNRR